MDWTFAEIIERASYGVDLYPGDVIGSGTVGTGCFLELNGTAKLENASHYEEQWLQDGDVVELEVEA
jgi:fumarylacetoacetate (FAA) hydrolase